MEEKRRFKAYIAGKEYTIVGNRSARHLNAVVDLVNQQLNQLEQLAPDLTIGDRSILMSINAVSDQLVKEQRIMELEEELTQLRRSQSSPSSSGRTNQDNTQNFVRRRDFPHRDE